MESYVWGSRNLANGDTGWSQKGMFFYPIQLSSLPEKRGLPAIAWMPHLYDGGSTGDFAKNLLRVIADRNQLLWPDKPNELVKYLSPDFSLAGIVRPISKWGVGLMGVERKHIPKEDWSRNAFKHLPDDGGGSL
jgi:hypothetical protein